MNVNIIIITIFSIVYLVGVVLWCLLSYQTFYEFNFKTFMFSLLIGFLGPIFPCILLLYQNHLNKQPYRNFNRINNE
jgi:hypothetical protein